MESASRAEQGEFRNQVRPNSLLSEICLPRQFSSSPIVNDIFAHSPKHSTMLVISLLLDKGRPHKYPSDWNFKWRRLISSRSLWITLIANLLVVRNLCVSCLFIILHWPHLLERGVPHIPGICFDLGRESTLKTLLVRRSTPRRMEYTSIPKIIITCWPLLIFAFSGSRLCLFIACDTNTGVRTKLFPISTRSGRWDPALVWLQESVPGSLSSRALNNQA